MITYFKDIYKSNEPHHVEFEKAIQRIREGKSKEICDSVRAGNKQDKMKLPVILFSGEFTKRANDGLKKLSGLTVMDFDHIGDRLESFFQRVKSDKYTMAAFLSPSGDGYKVVVKIPPSEKTYKQSCKALKEYYTDESLNYLDDVARACFESYDPNLYYNPDSDVFEVIAIDDKPRQIKTEGVSASFSECYLRLQKWLEDKISCHYVDGNKHTFLVRLASACNRFGLPEQEVVDKLYQDYGSKSPVPYDDFKSIVRRVYVTYAHQYSTSYFDSIGEPQNNDGGQPNDEIFEYIARDVIYLDSIWDRMVSTFHNGLNQAETTHFRTVDTHFKWLKKEMTVMGGLANHGKSTLITQLALIKSVKDGDRWAIHSPEQNPPDYFYNDIIHSYLGKPVDKTFINQCTVEEYRRGMEFVREHFYFVFPPKSPTPQYIRDRFEECVVKHKCTGVILDPFNQLDHDWDKHGRDDRYISRFLSDHHRWGQDTNTYNIIVAHPNSNISKLPNGNYDCPDYYNLAGGAMWANKCDNILATYRPYWNTDKSNTTVEFRSQKIKKQRIVGVTGTAILYYDFTTNRYREDNGNGYSNPLD